MDHLQLLKIQFVIFNFAIKQRARVKFTFGYLQSRSIVELRENVVLLDFLFGLHCLLRKFGNSILIMLLNYYNNLISQ